MRPSRLLSQPLFVAAIGLSAFLLFTLELLAARLVLPVFGGASSVWTTSLCFFTAVVFLGYLYAHLVATRLSLRNGALLHVAVAILVAAATLAAPADLASLRFAGMPAALNVMAVLVLVAGAPALLLSTTTPLLSDWFSQHGRDPWWLYAVSNAASLGGLLAYPLLIEPWVPLSLQRTALRVLLAVLVGLIACVAAGAFRAGSDVTGGLAPVPGAPAGLPLDAAPVAARPLTRRRRAVWLLAAAVPAGLLSATTTHLTTDHTSTPLLWVGPLAIYLASFIVAFSARGRRVLPVAEKLVPAAVTLMWVPYLARVSWPAPVLIAMLLAAYGVLAVAIHGRLALDRPDESHLTGFYLVVSAGGMVATAFVALAAPLLFNDVYEYPLLLVAGLGALALLPGPDWLPAKAPGATLRAAGVRLLPYVAVSAVLVATVVADSPAAALFVGVVLVVGAQVIVIGRTPRSLAIVTGIAVAALLVAFAPSHLERVRTFYGITEVRSDRDGQARTEIHGTTLHGLQFLDSRSAQPTSYFVRSGPLGDVFDQLAARRPGPARIAIVGLGIGTIAAYERPGDAMTYFEVDPAVVAIAQDTRYFSYLADAPSPPRVVLGDGRLSLEAQGQRAFDLVILDAFSSDSVPAHLLTREAMRAYERTLASGGVMAFQLTNRHFDLAPAVAATARSVGLDARTRSYEPTASEKDRFAAQASRWVIVARPGELAWFDRHGWERPGDGPVLTDDYSDILRLIRWR